jgi:peptidoglycan/LPS O-acetylase OafA/YrhL
MDKNQPLWKNNIPVIDLVRSLAILMVMAGHLTSTLPMPPPAFRWGWNQFQRAQIDGVLIFFMISGFLITRIIDLDSGGILRPSWKNFYVRRIARILPLFLLQIGLGLLVIFLFSDDSKKFNFCFKLPDRGTAISFWVSLFTFSFNWGDALFAKAWNSIGDHWAIFWSLAVEEQFYLFYPLILGFLGNLRNIVLFLTLVVILSWSGVFLLESAGISVSIGVGIFIISYGHIAAGALLYLLVKRCGGFLSGHQGLSLLIMAAGSILLLLFFLTDWPIAFFLRAPSIAMILLGGIHLPVFQSVVFRWSAAPGRYSYGNYLLHILVLFFIHDYLWNLNIVLAFAVFVAVTTSVSFVSYRFFELPMNLWIRKRLNPVNQ